MTELSIVRIERIYGGEQAPSISNTRLTSESAVLAEQIERLAREIHACVCTPGQV